MAKVVASAAYPGVEAGGVFQEESVEKIAAIKLYRLVQVARRRRCIFFENFGIEPDGSERIESQQVSISGNPFDSSVQAAQLSAHLRQRCLESMAGAFIIHLAAEQRQQAFARLRRMC